MSGSVERHKARCDAGVCTRPGVYEFAWPDDTRRWHYCERHAATMRERAEQAPWLLGRPEVRKLEGGER